MKTPPTDPQKRFLVILLGSTTLMIFVLLSAAVIIDPYNNFGSSIFEPVSVATRPEKLQLIRQLSYQPMAIVLGSSRSFAFDPSIMETVSGCPTFNLSLNNARPEDFLAFTRHIFEDLELHPRLLLVGLDIEAFDELPTQPGTMNNPLFREYLHLSRFEMSLNIIRTLSDSLNGTYLRDMVRSIFFHFYGWPARNMTFSKNGMIHNLKHYLPPDEWTEDAFSHLTLSHQYYRGLSLSSIEFLEEFVSYAESKNVSIVFFLPPYEPRMLDRLSHMAPFREMQHDVLTLMSTFTKNPHVYFFDFTSIDGFAGDADDFLDPGHAGESNINQMTRTLFKDPALQNICKGAVKN